MTDDDPALAADAALVIMHAEGDVILAARRVTETALTADLALDAYLAADAYLAKLKATLARPDTEGGTP